MKKLRVVVIIFLIFIGLIIIGFITGILSIPSIKSISNRWGEVTNNTTEIISSITIENNNPFRVIIPRVDVDYTVKMNNIEMAHGTVEEINLRKGETTLDVTSYFDNTKICEWWVSHIKNNETTIVEIQPVIVIDAEFTEPQIETTSKTIQINTNLINDVNTVDEKIINVGPINLTLKSIYANWGNITNETTELLLNISVYNPVPYSIPMPEITYNISMNNITIGNGSITDNLILKANNYSAINLVTKINNSLIDEWFVSHLQNNEYSILEITINAEIKYKEISYFIDELINYKYEFDTDILGHEL